jgi:hypothetical protein
MKVTSTHHLGCKPVKDWLEDGPPDGRQRLSAGPGATGERLYDWAWLPYGSATAPGGKKGLLIRRKLGQPQDFTFYLTLARQTAPSPISSGGRERAGPSSRRSKRPRARSVSTTMRSEAGPAGTATSPSPCSLTPTAPSSVGRPTGREDRLDLAAALLPYTLPEVRRLLWRLLGAQQPDPAQAAAWSAWRRRHQQRARRSHWKRYVNSKEARL